jgi:hypothetical protein
MFVAFDLGVAVDRDADGLGGVVIEKLHDPCGRKVIAVGDRGAAVRGAETDREGARAAAARDLKDRRPGAAVAFNDLHVVDRNRAGCHDPLPSSSRLAGVSP